MKLTAGMRGALGAAFALSVAPLGCGEPPRTAVDASSDAIQQSDGPVDTVDGSDASVDAPNQGLVSVTVNSPVKLGRLADAPVVFINPDGTMTRAMTDASGQAFATVTEGASVTVKFEENRGLATILDVKPGDQLVFGAGRGVNLSTTAVTFTAFEGDVDAYQLFSPCMQRPVSPGTTQLPDTICLGPLSNVELLVVAYKDYVPVAYARAQGVDLTGGAVTIPNTWSSFTELVLNYSNVPSSYSISGNYFDSPGYFGGGGSTNPPAHDLTVRAPAIAQGGYVATIITKDSYGSQSISQPLPAGATSYQLDISSVTQPWLTQLSFTPSTRTFAVQNGGGVALDFVTYKAAYGHVTNALTWSVFSPRLDGVVFPVLPPDLDPTWAELLGISVSTTEVEMLSGWDAVRPNLYGLTTTVYMPVFPFGRVQSQSLRVDY